MRDAGKYVAEDHSDGRRVDAGLSRADEDYPPRGDRDDQDHRPRKTFLREFPVLVLLALVLALGIKTFLVQAFFIPSPSMASTLEPGDRVLVNRVVYHLRDPRRGDVMVFVDPNPPTQDGEQGGGGFFGWLGRGFGLSTGAPEDFIKRVVGLPGETIQARDGHVFIDGRQLAEPYLPAGTVTGNFAPVEIPEDEYFVMGDNRNNSRDSRYGLGTIPRNKIVGKAFVIIWPPSGWGRL